MSNVLYVRYLTMLRGGESFRNVAGAVIELVRDRVLSGPQAADLLAKLHQQAL